MQKIGALKCAAILAATLFSSDSAYCQNLSGTAVQEIQEGSNTELNVINDSSSGALIPFDVVAFIVVSKSGGADPSTIATGWTVEALDATLWGESMGGVGSGLPTWQDYTGKAYTTLFPNDPAEVNAYVTTPGAGNEIAPGDSLDGFFFQGAANAADHFVLVKDHDPNVVIEGDQLTASGTVQVVPEPNSSNLCLMAMCLAFFSPKKFLRRENFLKLPRIEDELTRH